MQRTEHRVPYLHDAVIESEARLLLSEWATYSGQVLLPPVPIEEILECLLGLQFEIDDLRGTFNSQEILGAIWFGRKLIKIDCSLDPTKDPKKLGRYRFTIAHEVGHWRLHRAILAAGQGEANLFQQETEPAFVCRTGSKPREEWQADAFAQQVLMPGPMVIDAWRAWRRDDRPQLIAGILHLAPQTGAYPDPKRAMERFCKPLADHFKVSAQAMRIRLVQLQLLVDEIQPSLFG